MLGLGAPRVCPQPCEWQTVVISPVPFIFADSLRGWFRRSVIDLFLYRPLLKSRNTACPVSHPQPRPEFSELMKREVTPGAKGHLVIYFYYWTYYSLFY